MVVVGGRRERIASRGVGSLEEVGDDEERLGEGAVEEGGVGGVFDASSRFELELEDAEQG